MTRCDYVFCRLEAPFRIELTRGSESAVVDVCESHYRIVESSPNMEVRDYGK